jgi:hypothetical protein
VVHELRTAPKRPVVQNHNARVRDVPLARDVCALVDPPLELCQRERTAAHLGGERDDIGRDLNTVGAVLPCIPRNRDGRQRGVAHGCLHIGQADRRKWPVLLMKDDPDENQCAVEERPLSSSPRSGNWIIDEPAFQLRIVRHAVPVGRRVKTCEDARRKRLKRRFLAERRQELAAAPSRRGGPPACRAFIGTSQPIPAKTDQPMEPPHNPANRHSYIARPTRRTKQPILIAVAVNEPRPRVWPRIMARSGRRLARSRQLTSGTTTRSHQATAPANERFAGRKRRRG